MDTSVVFKLTVLGSILAPAVGQNYGFTNMGLANRRVQPYFVRQQVAPQTPGFMPGQGFQANPLGKAFRGNPVAMAFGGANPFAGRGAVNSFTLQQGAQGVGRGVGRPSPAAAAAAAAPTPPSQLSQDQKKLVDMLVHVISTNHKANQKTQTDAPVSSRRTHSQPGNVEPHSHVFVHSHGQNQQPHVHVAQLSHNGRDPLAPNPTFINSQPTTDVLRSSPALTGTNHPYRPAAVPNVLSSNPTRRNLHSTVAENNLQVPNILQSGVLDVPHEPSNLPFFLTGEKKTTQPRHVNSALLKPTHMSVVPIRRQIPPPSQPTQPTNTEPVTKPQASPKKEEDEEEEAEEEEEEPDRSRPPSVPSRQRPNFTQLTPPNGQIPAPRPVPVRPAPTTQVPMGTSVSASTPTTMPVPSLIPGAINPFANQHVVQLPGQ
ncbi:probable serine/threonine-protein kinase samkC [Haliotis cracherodii]|uniref:probable serine/threonine-protein kinase samkC n=1 Tax=Haliotis cracherodii TaxID=6455 RepID=UPI0039EA7B4F